MKLFPDKNLKLNTVLMHITKFMPVCFNK